MYKGLVIGDRGVGASGDTHADWMLAYAETGSFVVVGASVVGKLHLAGGLPRDDAFIVRSVGPWLALAVSDGVGSRPLSRYGASYTVEALSSLLLRPFTGEPLPPSSAEQSPDACPQPLTAEQRAPFVTTSGHTSKKRNGFLAKLTRLFGKSAPDRDRLSGISEFGSFGWSYASSEARSAYQKEMHTNSTHEPGRDPERSEDPPADKTAIAGGTSADVSQEGAVGRSGPVDGPAVRSAVEQAFEKTHLGLRQHAEFLGITLSDLSCTGLGVLINAQNGLVAAGQIGDGAIICLACDGSVSQLVDAPDPEDGEAVYTLNRPEFRRYLKISVSEPAPNPFHAILVMTDGVSSDLIYAPVERLEAWTRETCTRLGAAARPAEAAAELFNWLNSYSVKGSWDDRTLVAVLYREH